jgi:hypothetical protein
MRRVYDSKSAVRIIATALAAASILGCSRSKADAFLNWSTDAIDTVSTAGALHLVALSALPHDTLRSLPADGASLAIISVSGSAPPPSLVGLSTTGGVFATSTASTTAVTLIADTGSTLLRAPTDIVPIIVTASVGGRFVSDTITVTWAYPQQLSITADSLAISDTIGFRKITVSATRHPGSVTRGTPIMFSSSAGGTFDAPLGTDSTGTVVAHYTLVGDKGAHTGFVTITAFVAPLPAVPGDTIKTSLTLQINPAAVPVLTLSTLSASLNSTASSAATVVDSIQVTNAGTGAISGLSTGSIVYGAGQPVGWLRVSLGFTTTGAPTEAAPAVLVLTASAANLLSGTYTATVPVTSSTANTTPQLLTVSFVVK